MTTPETKLIQVTMTLDEARIAQVCIAVCVALLNHDTGGMLLTSKQLETFARRDEGVAMNSIQDKLVKVVMAADPRLERTTADTFADAIIRILGEGL